MINLTNSWMTNITFVSQTAHFMGAIAIIMSVAHFLGMPIGLITGGLIILFALIKEFWFDLAYELPKQTLADSELDFAFYFLGVIVACGMLLI